MSRASLAGWLLITIAGLTLGTLLVQPTPAAALPAPGGHTLDADEIGWTTSTDPNGW